MTDLFISHSSKTPDNKEKVARLAEILGQRWNVWWDDVLVGRYPQVIESKIREARCIVPVWTEASRASDAMRAELDLAKSCDKHIVPVRMEDCSAPFAFGSYSGVDLRGWNGMADHPAMQQLTRKLASVVPPSKVARRPQEIFDARLKLPALFMSVSSYETQLTPLAALHALRIFEAEAILVSAYDLFPERRDPQMCGVLKRIRNHGGLVLVDSGNYEATRLGDAGWTPRAFKLALKDVPHDLAFSFDVLEPSTSPKAAVEQIVEGVTRDSRYTAAPILPIVHAPFFAKKGYALEKFPTVIRGVAESLQPQLIAVPERELGQGLIERAKNVQRIRQELDKLPFYQPLHLLGTGNPWSIVVLAAAGADSFDGLEWCRVAVDRVTNRLNHFQHYDLFTDQSSLAISPRAAGVLGDDAASFNAKVTFQNLDYFAELGIDLRRAAARANFEALVVGILGSAHKKTLIEKLKLFP